MDLHDTSGTTNDIEASAARVRIRRGARVIGLDRDLGSVQQIVVDQGTGELRGIVVHRASDGAEFEIPVDALTRATSREVRVNLVSADLDKRPDLARPYNADQYVAVQPGDTAPRTQATRTARDTDHPVVTSVEQDAADLIAPPNVRTATDTAVDQAAPSTPGANTTAQSTDLAMPPSLANNSAAAEAKTDEQGADTVPRHDAARSDPSEETTVPAPSRAESATPGVTGDLIGGKPSTGGMGASSTVPGSTIPSREPPTTTGNAAPIVASPAAPTANEDDLSDLTDDELSNPDTALINPHPGAEDRIARPFNRATSSADTASGHTAPTAQERAGMRSAFRTATNTSADDTHVDRAPQALAPDFASPDPQDDELNDDTTLPPGQPATDTPAYAQPDAADLIEPREGGADALNALRANPTGTLASWLAPAPVKAGIAAAIVAGDIALRLLGARQLRAFGRGALLGAALALVLAPMPGSHLRAQLVEATDRLRSPAA